MRIRIKFLCSSLEMIKLVQVSFDLFSSVFYLNALFCDVV